MMPALWLRQMLALAARAKPFRALVLIAIIAGAAMALVSGLGSMTKVPKDRQAAAMMGSADAIIASNASDIIEPGSAASLNPPYNSNNIKQTVLWDSLRLPLSSAGQVDLWDYYEGVWPSIFTQGKVELVSGDWPNQAGECAITGDSPEVSSPIGSWPLVIVGKVKDIADPISRPQLFCAPGSWQEFKIADNLRPLINQSLARQVLLSGKSEDIDAFSSTLASSGVMLNTREGIAEEKLKTGKIISDIGPWVALSGVVALGMGTLLGGWVGRHARQLHSFGSRSRVFSLWCTGMISLSVFAGAFLGGLFAQISLKFAFPLISHVWHEAIVPVKVTIGATLATSMIVVACAVAGIGVGIRRYSSAAKSSRDVRRRFKAPHRKGAAKRNGIVAAVLWVASGVAIFMIPDHEMSWVALIAVLLSTAVAVTSHLIVSRVAKGSRSDGSAISLAARRLASIPHGGITTGLSIVVVLLLVASVVATGYGYAKYRLALSEVPPGVATVATTSIKGTTIPDQVLTQFATDIGIQEKPIPIYETMWHPQDGGLWGFDSIADAEKVLGSLTSEQQDHLARGGILLQAEPPSGGIFVLRSVASGAPEATPLSPSIMAFTSSKGHEFQVAGFYLIDPIEQVRDLKRFGPTRWVFTGLNSRQDQAAYRWADTSGLAGVRINAYRPATGQLVTTILVLSLGGFVLVLAGVVAALLRGEAMALRHQVAGLDALGIPRSWPQRVLLWLSTWLVIVPVATGVVAGLLLALLPGVLDPWHFNIKAVPWVAIAGSVVIVCLAGIAGALIAGRRLNHRERLRELV